MTAGFGTRLQPLTFFVPKPLLPVGGIAVAEHSLRSLSKLGCRSVALNLHHMGGRIREHFGSKFGDLGIEYSTEDQIRGTLGALAPLEDFLAEADIAVIANGDTFCEWPWASMIETHLQSEADATLLLHEGAPEEELGGAVGVDDEGQVVQLREYRGQGKVARRHIFAGAHILGKRLLSNLEHQTGDIIAGLYIPLLERGGRIQTVVTSVDWHDLGSPERFLRANMMFLNAQASSAGGSQAVSGKSHLAGNAVVSRTSVLDGAVVHEDVSVESSIVFPNAVVGAGSQVKACIVGPGVQLPPESVIEDRLITLVREGDDLAHGQSLLGGLVYSPIRSA